MKRLSAVLLVVGAVVAAVVAVVVLTPRPVRAQGQSSTPLATAHSDVQETSFGDLAADALREVREADVAVVAAISFIRTEGSLDRGPVTAERVSSLLANPDEMWALCKLTGAQLRAALEHSVSSAPLPNTAFLQVSAGLQFEYAPAAPRGQRVLSVRVGFNDLDAAATYRVAMPLSLAKGGSGYFKIIRKEDILKQGDPKDPAQTLAATIVEYATKKGTVSPTGFGRITAQQ